MRHGILNSGVAGALVLGWAAGVLGESVDLRPKFTNGRVTCYHTSIKTVQVMKTGSKPREMATSTDTAICLTVKRVRPDGGAEVEYATLYLAMDGGLPQKPVRFDTRNPKDPASNPTFSGLTSLIDNPVLLSISPTGTIEKVTGVEKVVSSLPPRLSNKLSNVFSERTLLRMHESFSPGRKTQGPVRVGATWKDRATSPLAQLGTLVNSMEFALEGINAKAKTAEITMKSVVSSEADKDSAPSGYSITDGKSSARMTWDLSAGELVRSESQLQMTLLTGGADVPAGLGMTITHNVRTTIERVALKNLTLPRASKPVRKPPGD